jgi:hypothetical protein
MNHINKTTAKLLFGTLLPALISAASVGQSLDWLNSYKTNPAAIEYALDIKCGNSSDVTYAMGIYYHDTLNTGVVFAAGPVYGFLVKIDAAGDTVWKWNNNTTATDPGQGLYPSAIAVDADDNIYMAGEYSLLASNLSIDIGGYQMPMGPFYYGGFIAKFDSSGNVLWMRGNSAAADYNDIDVDAYGNIYVLGNTQSSITFGSTTITPSISNIYRDFIVSYDTGGNLLWAKGYGEVDLNNTVVTNKGALLSIAVDKGAVPLIYAAGYFLTPYNANGNTFTSTGAEDALLLKLDMNGNYLNGLTAGAGNLDAFYTVALNTNGELALGGLYRTSTTINGNNYNATSNYNTLLVKMDTTFNYEWVKNSLISANPPMVAIDNYGRCAISDGNFFGAPPVPFNFLQVYDSSGTMLFNKTVTGTGSSQFSGLSVLGMAFSNSGNKLYVTGGYKAQMTIDTATINCTTSFEFEMWELKLTMPGVATEISEVNNATANADIYPDPVHDILNFKNPKNEPMQIKIYNSVGEKVADVSIGDGNTVDVSAYKSGIYFYQLFTDVVATGKIIKE